MNRKEYLLLIAMEECNEISHRISKVLRFGEDEIQYGQSLTNIERLKQEVNDLVVVFDLLLEEGIDVYSEGNTAHIKKLKREKIEKWMNHSKNRGNLK